MYKKIFLILISVLILCSCSKSYDNYKVGYSSNMLNTVDREELKEVFDDYELSNIDTFFKWLDEFNELEDKGCGIKDWSETNTFTYSAAACANRYERKYDFSDGNCRITSFALLQNDIEMNTKDEEYESYLMFDMDVIENNKNYEVIKKDEQKFINLFNEMDVSYIKKEEYKNVFPNRLKSLNFKLNKKGVSLISVVINDNDFDLLFVGHAGILIDLNDKYLFVEKIAFEQPYQISVLKEKEDLINLFKERKTYFGDEKEEGPFIYENDKLIYEF